MNQRSLALKLSDIHIEPITNLTITNEFAATGEFEQKVLEHYEMVSKEAANSIDKGKT